MSEAKYRVRVYATFDGVPLESSGLVVGKNRYGMLLVDICHPSGEVEQIYANPKQCRRLVKKRKKSEPMKLGLATTDIKSGDVVTWDMEEGLIMGEKKRARKNK